MSAGLLRFLVIVLPAALALAIVAIFAVASQDDDNDKAISPGIDAPSGPA